MCWPCAGTLIEPWPVMTETPPDARLDWTGTVTCNHRRDAGMPRGTPAIRASDLSANHRRILRILAALDTRLMPDGQPLRMCVNRRRLKASAETMQDLYRAGLVNGAGSRDPCAVLRHHYPSVPNLGDMTRFEEWPDAAIDVLVGGTPCQDYSIAGARAGLAGSRGALTSVYVSIARRFRPRWMLWENVPGVFSTNDGRDFGAVLGDMAGWECPVPVPEGGWQNSGIVSPGPGGYGLAWVVRDAQYVRTLGHPRAVPQRRRRVFVVGYLGDWRPAAAVLLERDSLRGDPPPRREARQGAANPLASCPRGGGGIGTDLEVDGRLIPEVAATLRAEGFDASEDGTGRGTPILPVCHAIQERAVSENPENGPGGAGFSGSGVAYTIEARSKVQPVAVDSKGSQVSVVSDGSTPTLRAMGHSASHANAGGQLAVAFDAQAGGETGLAVGEVAGALHGGGKHGGRAAVAFQDRFRGDDGRGYARQPAALEGHTGTLETVKPWHVALGDDGSPPLWQVRRLTPRECERLQGFRDDYTLIPYRRGMAKDGPRYKALGNSMAVNVMHYLGCRIELVNGMLPERARHREGHP